LTAVRKQLLSVDKFVSWAKQKPDRWKLLELFPMTALPKHKMTVDEYLAWAEDKPGRFELYAGVVYAMTPERAGHATVKFAVQTALRAAIRRSGVPCHMLPDGMTVRIDAHTAHEPDALVYCGENLPDSAVEVPNPVIMVEVNAPRRCVDQARRLFSRARRAALPDRRSGPAPCHSPLAGSSRHGGNADCPRRPHRS
jgi:hypothetical protein